MSRTRFDEEKSIHFHTKKSGVIVRFLIKNSRGLIKNQNQANKLLLVVAVFAILCSLLILISGSPESVPLPVTSEI